MTAAISSIGGAEVGYMREQLIERVDQQIGWRRQKAEEFPDDKRNDASAEALCRLYEALESLPADHALWVRYWRAYEGPGAPRDPFRLGELHDEYLRSYGFHAAKSGNAEDFLQWLVDELERTFMDAAAPSTRQ